MINLINFPQIDGKKIIDYGEGGIAVYLVVREFWSEYNPDKVGKTELKRHLIPAILSPMFPDLDHQIYEVQLDNEEYQSDYSLDEHIDFSTCPLAVCILLGSTKQVPVVSHKNEKREYYWYPQYEDLTPAGKIIVGIILAAFGEASFLVLLDT